MANNSNSKLNTELFYDNQLQRDGLTWELFRTNPSSAGASSESILRGLLGSSDFSYNVSHSYGGMVNDVTKEIKDLADIGNDVLDVVKLVSAFEGTPDAVRKTGNMMSSDKLTKLGNLMGDGVELLKKTGNDLLSKIAGDPKKAEEAKHTIKDIARGRVFSALDFIKVFNGTTVSISVPRLEVTLLSGSGQLEGGSVKEAVSKLNDIFLGDIRNFGGLFGLQAPPNQYLPTFDAVDSTTQFEGTFSLRLGSDRALNNLIVTDYNVDLSKNMRLLPEDDNSADDYLYAKVSITLMPASYVSKEMLKNYYNL